MAESNILEIIQGLGQAAANAYDGAHDERILNLKKSMVATSRMKWSAC